MRWILLLCALAAPVAWAQTTQGLISGRILNSQTGSAISGAQVAYAGSAANASGAARSNPSGYFVLPLLSPGVYRVRVTAAGFQAQELQVLELPVAARIELDFRLRPLSDVWEAGQYRSVFVPNSDAVVTFYGPDVDTSRFGSFEAARGRVGALESTVSEVIDPAQVRELPLAGRDVYTMLVTQPGVTADTATARGLGLSINGQRPSSSNFLLDGLENNNYLVTGPLTALAPEAVQEYRVSTNNFSAEYGRTAGFVANAVTVAGGSRWHGLGYWNLKNEALNANGFQENRRGRDRSPLKENQVGFQAGGPVWRRSLFVSSAFDRLRSRGRAETTDYLVPTTTFLDFTAPDSLARRLLQQFPAPPVTGRLPVGLYSVAPPSSVDRSLALERVDYQPGSGTHRFMGRLAIARLGRPDFIWTPYKDFISPLSQNTSSIAITAVSSLRPSLTNEARAGFSWDNLHWDRPHPEIPSLSSGDGVTLPGSPAFYEYRNKSRSTELVENLIWAPGRHIFKAGGGLLLRRLDGALTAGRDGLYAFRDILDFTLDAPNFISASLDRTSLPSFAAPSFDRSYRYSQYFFFAQDTFKATSRLVLNYGIRYENFGSPSNTGPVKDAAVELGSGSTLATRLSAARLTLPPAGNQSLYSSDKNDWGLRFGFSYAPLSRTVVRGAYGIFYDRPFENLWQNLRNNNIVLAGFVLPATRADYLAPIATAIRGQQGKTFNTAFPSLTLFQPGIRSAYVQSWFFGVQQQLASSWTIEVNTLGALGRKLITTDEVNRPFSLPLDAVSNREGRLNPALPRISYRANQGSSDYNALTFVTRYRTSRRQFQLSYTWSHSIDNQSEPLAGDFFDLSFTRITQGTGSTALSAFSRQFDSRVDRGSSDFDQRHNLVFYSLWEYRGFRFSQLAAFRSGFPYSVTAPSRFVAGGDPLVNNRADLVLADPTASSAIAGGQVLLDRAAFREPLPGRLGNTGRNAFAGPGLFNVDISLSRSFALPRLGESARLTLRADAFNFLNHANLNNPDSLITSGSFGTALYGRQGRQSGFPALTPFNETARQIQLLLRIQF